ncbi:MAG: LamG-like jellyroll fold domain-containing protein [bacterium]|nr:LamG-like jellyroll fold domain-containing protein [bacterium]
MGRKLALMSVVVGLGAILSPVSAKTVAWYRFDEGVPGEVTTAETRLANSADDSSVPAATPHSQSGTTWGTDENYMPRFAAPVGADVLQVRDPVTGTVYPNRAALKFMGEVAASVNPASALDVPNDNLKLASFTAECFFRAPSNIGTQTMSTLLHMQRQTGAATWTLQIYGGGLFVRSTIKTGGSTTVKCDYVKYETDKIKDGKWHHAAITYDATTYDMSLWLDYAKLHTWNYGANDGFDYRANGKFLIGANTVQSGRNFPGEMDEVRISDTALDADGFLRLERPGTGLDPDTIVRVSFASDPREAAWIGDDLNEVPNAPYTVTLTTKGTALPETQKIGDTATRATTNISEGVWGANRANTAAFLCKTNAPAKGQCLVVNDPHGQISTNSFTAECFFKFDGPQVASSADGVTGYSLVPMACSGFLAIFDARPSYLGQFVLRSFTNETGSYTQKALTGWKDKTDWHHLAVVYDRPAQRIQYYVDYELAATHNAAFRGGAEVASGGEFVFGANSAGGSQPFSGWLDECRIVRRALKPWEFLTDKHTEGPVRIWLDFEDGLASKPDPMGKGEGKLDDPKTVGERVQQTWRHAVLDVDGNVVRANQSWSFHTKNSRFRTPRLEEGELTAFTVELFLRAKNLVADRNVFALGSSKLAALRYWSLRAGSTTGSLCFKLSTADAEGGVTEQKVDFPEGNYADDAWRHIAISIGPAETGTEVKLYVNQTLVKTETVPGAYVTTRAGDNPDLNVGASGIDALLDEVRILAGVQGPDAFLYPPPPSGTLLLVR